MPPPRPMALLHVVYVTGAPPESGLILVNMLIHDIAPTKKMLTKFAIDTKLGGIDDMEGIRIRNR